MQALDIVSSLASSGAMKQTRLKDIRTALNKLADAYQIPLEEIDLAAIEATYPDTLKTYFATLDSSVSQHTVRNTFQNLGQLYKAAHANSLLTSPAGPHQPRRLSYTALERDMREHSPYQAHRAGKARVPFGLPPQYWPAEIVQGWRSYAAMKAIEVRGISLNHYVERFSKYMGYNLRHDPEPPERWEHLFEIPRILRYIAWLAERVGAQRISKQGQMAVTLLVDIAKNQERPEYAALQKFTRRLPQPAKVYNKKAPRHTVSLVDLDRLGVTLMAEARQPRQGSHEGNGARRAVKFAAGLTIRLLVRCPRRSREIREMDLDGRLYQDHDGTWQLYYQAHQLKIAEHDHAPNEFRMPWPPDLVSDLEEYLRVYRPILLGRSTSTNVFLSIEGNELNRNALYERIALPCWERLQKHVYPHLFRTLWCDAYLDTHPGDYEGAAAMLNDTEDTVRKRYRNFRVEQHLRKATAFNAKLFGTGNGKRTSP